MLQFLCSIISQSVIATSDCSAVSSHAVNWPQLVMKLAPLFGVNVDFLMRHYVLELYASGLDKIAQEVNKDRIAPYLSRPTVTL